MDRAPAFQRGVALLLWTLVGVAKTMALALFVTAPDTRLPDALAWLALAFGLVGAALAWRNRATG